jgi:hypothetical protein
MINIITHYYLLPLVKAKLKDPYVLVHGGNMPTDTLNRLSKSNDYPLSGHLAGKIWGSIILALTVGRELNKLDIRC